MNFFFKKKEYHISCGIIPVFKHEAGEDEFLVVELHHGGISFPKGHTEPDETCLETAERELLEETGLVCSSILADTVITEQYLIKRPDKLIHKTVHYYIGFLDTQDVTMQSEEIRNYYWGNSEKTMEKINHRESCQVLEKALIALG